MTKTCQLFIGILVGGMYHNLAENTLSFNLLGITLKLFKD